VYATAVCLWEALTGKRLFDGANEGSLVNQVLKGEVKRPGELVPDLFPAVDPLVMRGLDREPANRFATAREMATALEDAVPLANPSTVGAWVEQAAAEALARKAAQLAEIERTSSEANVPADDAEATVPAPPPREAVHIDSEPPTREPMYSVSLPTMGGTKNPAADAVPEAPAPEAPLRPTRPRRAVLLVGGGVAVVALVAVLVTALRSPETETRPGATATITTTAQAPSPPEPTYVPVAVPSPVATEATSSPEAGAAPAATSASNAVPPSTAPRPRAASHAPAPSPTKHAPPAPTHGAIVFTNPG
jgi:eukaryotic-like serine/threonine-protein kinase